MSCMSESSNSGQRIQIIIFTCTLCHACLIFFPSKEDFKAESAHTAVRPTASGESLRPSVSLTTNGAPLAHSPIHLPQSSSHLAATKERGRGGEGGGGITRGTSTRPSPTQSSPAGSTGSRSLTQRLLRGVSIKVGLGARGGHSRADCQPDRALSRQNI